MHMIHNLLKAVLFDLDETLCLTNQASEEAMKQIAYSVVREADSANRLLSAWHSVRANFWHDPECAEWGVGNPKRAREVCFSKAVQLSGIKLNGQYSNEFYIISRMTALTLVEGALQLLKELSCHHIKIGIITNGDPTEQTAKIAVLGLKPLVNAVTISNDFLAQKPAPDLFLHAMKELCVQPKETIMIGDNEKTDGLGSRAAGIRFVHLFRNDCLLQQTFPHKHISSLSELTTASLVNEICSLGG